MSDAGGGTPVEGLTLSFDDVSPVELPDHAPLSRGTCHPANHDPHTDAMLAEASLSLFQGTDPNGLWSLHIFDDEGRDHGVVSNGW